MNWLRGSKSMRRGHVRVIHIRLPADLHRKLRVRAALDDKSIQEWVASLIAQKLASPRGSRRLD